MFRSHEKHTALDNGPYLVRGPVTITDAEGNQFHTDRETVALCRCGARRPNRSAMAHIRRQVFRQRTGTSNRRARVKSKRSSPNWVIESLRLFLATPLMARVGRFAHYLEASAAYTGLKEPHPRTAAGTRKMTFRTVV